MREILFRGKRTDNGEWETGSLVSVIQGCTDERVFIADKTTGFITPILPSTVGQYTGLTDKNGNKIFEGDILEFTDADKDKTPYEIYWDESSSAWYIRDCEGCIDNCDPWVKEYFEVIGNVHDNPKLLEVSE